VSWTRLAVFAPEFAALCRSRLEEPGVALLGTLRLDGAPRIDPVEPHFVEDNPDVKLSGRVKLSAARAGWWAGRPAKEATVYALQVEEAVVIEWNIPASRMVVRRWTPTDGESVTQRTYP
jgi:hypothetical protein